MAHVFVKGLAATMPISPPGPEGATLAAQKNRKPVNLALQGGGTHGAFTWGVLDRLIEDGRLSIEAISGTSAGAMNGVVMAYGMATGGADGARAKLEEFWREISIAGEFFNPLRPLPWEQPFNHLGYRPEFSSTFAAFQIFTQLFSPYQINPLNLNPLRDVLLKVVDFSHLCQWPHTPRLFVCATNVRTCKIKVFGHEELSADAVLASACLPYIFQAVEIDGECYWDGGFMGNPAIFPLIYHGACQDVIIVHIDPIVRTVLPRTGPEILDRMNEISFNSSLMREMRAIAFVTRLIDTDVLHRDNYRRMLIHSIRDDAGMERLGFATKFDTDWDFLCRLRDMGRRTAEEWLKSNFDAVGRESSVNLAEVFL